MNDSPLARPLVFEGRILPAPVGGGDDRWRSLVAELADSLTGAAIECHDQLRKTSDPVLGRQLQALRSTAILCLEDLNAMRETVDRVSLTADGLFSDLRRLARRFAFGSGIDVALRLPRREQPLPGEVAWAVHTVVDEALDGLARLSRATGVVLTVASSERAVLVTMRDDGVSLITRQGRGWRTSPHAALRAIRRAVEPFRGSARLWPLRPRGLMLRAEVPLSAENI
jgi:signal transduction histidine kinase